MRRVPTLAVITCIALILITGVLSYAIGSLYATTLIGWIVWVILNVGIYRTCALLFPPRHTREYTEKDPLFYFDVMSMYNVFFVYPILHTKIFPLPIGKLLHQCFGMKLGKNSYPSESFITDPYHFISVGKNVIFGAQSTITPHTYDTSNRLFIKPISIGSNVTIGIHSVILPGVIIEDDATIAAGAVVTKNTHVKKGEVWAGIPARKIRDQHVSL